MTDVWEREASSAGAERRSAVRAAQLSTTNVHAFRRLRWGLPRLLSNRTAGGQRQFTIADLMIVIVVFSAFGLVALLAWPH